jgi:hypothetical protein
LDLLYRQHVTGNLKIQWPAEREFQRGAGQ